MKTAGEITVGLVYDSSMYDIILEAIGGSNEAWTVTFPDSSTFVVSGFIANQGAEIPMDDVITSSVTIQLSGTPAFTDAS